LGKSNSAELDPDTNHPVVKFMPEQNKVNNVGGSMRLGQHEIKIRPGTKAESIYGTNTIHRRHRHRYEFNQEYGKIVEEHGMILSAHSDNGSRIEIVEIPSHPFYFAVQYHSEFHSRPGRPEQSYAAFIKAAAMLRS
jgi:CTP synthase